MKLGGLAFAVGMLCSQIANAASIDAILARFEGEYRSTIDQSNLSPTDEGTTYTFIRAVHAPEFGSHVLYVEHRNGGPESKVAAQFLFSFAQDQTGVYTDAYTFPDGAMYVRADAIPQRLQLVTPNKLTAWPEGCRIRWSEAGDAFTGATAKGTCPNTPRDSSDATMTDRVYQLAKNHFTVREQIADRTGKVSAPRVTRHTRVPQPNLDAQADNIFKAFEGAFENRPTSAKDTPGAQEIASLFTLARRVDVPIFGSRVMYLEFRRGGIDGKVELQRLIRFEDDPNRPANVMRSYNFRDGTPYVGAHLEPRKLAGLTVNDVEQLPVGCEHIWHVQNNVLIGSVTRDTCHLYILSMKQWRHVSLEYMLDGTSLHMWERGFDPEGKFRFGTASPVRFPRVRPDWP